MTPELKEIIQSYEAAPLGTPEYQRAIDKAYMYTLYNEMPLRETLAFNWAVLKKEPVMRKIGYIIHFFMGTISHLVRQVM